MGTTVGGLPYPEPTDPVAGGAASIRALAEALENDIPAGIAAGFLLWPALAAGAVASLGLTFPVGRFTAPPRMNLTAVSAAPNQRAMSTGTPTASSVTVYIWNGGGAGATPSAHWTAVQDRAVAAGTAAPREGETFGWVVCSTPGCPNAGHPIEVQTAYVDDEGNVQQVGGFVCGACGVGLVPGVPPG